MNKLTKTLATAALLALLVSLSACSPKPIDEPDHKAQTKACLISPEVVVPGTPDKQLAADLVEAEILYGLAVRKVKINQVTSSIPNKLLDALQAGCVLMVSSTQDFLLPLADFAKIHPNMMVLFVGSEIDAIIQPANFRWVADDLVSGARLAGYFAASVAVTEDVHLFVQKDYSQAKEIQKAFQSGVRDFEFDSKVKKNIVKIISPDALVSLLGSLDSDGVVTIFAGKSTWMSIEQQESSVPFIVGADLQLG